MPETWIDPGSLEGDALTQWYLRSPADIERERQEAAARRYQNFFEGPGNDPDPQFGREVPASSLDADPGFAIPTPSRGHRSGIHLGPSRPEQISKRQGGDGRPAHRPELACDQH
jgi:hypothetical protein